MQKLRFHNNRVENYTIILANRNFQFYGQLTDVKDITYNANLNSADEISFTVYRSRLTPTGDPAYEKDIEAFRNYIWENLIDLKLIYVKELEEYFQIKVSIDDANDTVKSVTGLSLCEAELSQLNLYHMEINSESDILREDYEETVFYNEKNPNASLLHRILKDKAPHYKIGKVDENLCNLYRVFSIDGTSIYDFLTGECAKEFDCLFQFDSATRTISAYALADYGKDTTIYVDKTNLTDSVHLEVNSDSIKNCFKLEGGDETMTAAIRSLNPTGTDYIYLQRQEDLDEMPEELKQRLKDYYHSEHGYFEKIDEYKNISKEEYDLYDDIAYYTSSMMPTREHATVTAESEGKKIESALTSVSLKEITKSTSVSTVNNAVKMFAKLLVKSGYVKIEIEPGSTFQAALIEQGESTGELAIHEEKKCHYGEWNGSIKITNYSDKEDTYIINSMTVLIYENFGDYIRQEVHKSIQSDDDDGSVFDVLTIKDPELFQSAVRLYSLNRLRSFNDAIHGALNVLAEQKQAQEGALLYEDFYLIYQKKLSICQEEIATRQETIDQLEAQAAEKELSKIKMQKELNLAEKLGDLYPVFCSYRREDTYSNSNYISDGLSNAQLFQRAQEFWDMAQKELEKSSAGECTITSTLYNLLAIPEFQPLADSFALGNWIHVKVDGNLYRLRLIGYSIHFDTTQTINVTFSTVSKVQNEKTEREAIIASAKSMATGIQTISKQAQKGKIASDSIQDMVQNGLNSALVQIRSNDKEEVTYGNHGILCRAYDDTLEKFDDKQLKITHNNIILTDNNWESARQAIGEHHYSVYDETRNDWIEHSGYGLTSDFVQSGQVSGATIVGGMIYSDNYQKKQGDKEAAGTYIDLKEGKFSFGGGALTFDGNNLLIHSPSIPTDAQITALNQECLETTNILAQELKIKSANIQGQIIADSVAAENITGTTLSGKKIVGGSLLIGNKDNTYTEITEHGLIANHATFNGEITGGSINIHKTTTQENPYLYVSDDANENKCVAIWSGSVCCMDHMPVGEAALDYNCEAVIKTETDDGFAELNGAEVNAFGFNNVSLESKKKNIESLENGLDILKKIDIYQYHYKTERDDKKKHIGLVIGDDYHYAKEITNHDDTSVDLYSLVSVCVKAIQELQEKVEKLECLVNTTFQ